MTLAPPSEIRNVTGLAENELQLIHAYLQGAVYCWVKNCSGKWFAVRDLVGGENNDWSGTPLQRLYEKHIESGKNEEEAFESAAKDAGWIMKAILDIDSRVFEFDNSGYTNMYRWNADE